jgi:hypothetical protein
MNMHANSNDLKKITLIMLRAASLMNFERYGMDRLAITMDLTACHLNGCKLDLDGLLAAKEFDLIHDVSGIMHHIDRKTGMLLDCFLPRYAKRETIPVELAEERPFDERGPIRIRKGRKQHGTWEKWAEHHEFDIQAD